jgi:hypothetical protein
MKLDYVFWFLHGMIIQFLYSEESGHRYEILKTYEYHTNLYGEVASCRIHS